MKRKRIVVMGFMGSCPIAGVIWQHVHYIVGLQRLGHDVYYIEDSARIPYNAETFDTSNDFSYATKLLARLASEFDFKDRWAFCARYLAELPTVGLSLREIRQHYKSADAILNVCGTKEFPVPIHGLKWLSTRQPVVTDLWKTRRPPPSGAVFTSVANWSTSGLKDIIWRGEKYLWSKSREFMRFVNAPKAAGETFELATDIKDEKTRTKFSKAGWRFRSPHDLSVNYGNYRRHSRAAREIAREFFEAEKVLASLLDRAGL